MSIKNLESNQKIHEYVSDASLRESELLKELREVTKEKFGDIMQIPPEQGQFMALLDEAYGGEA